MIIAYLGTKIRIASSNIFILWSRENYRRYTSNNFSSENFWSCRYYWHCAFSSQAHHQAVKFQLKRLPTTM